jgi:protein-S-isoprenylcysteine O-methyltransferase Ste14
MSNADNMSATGRLLDSAERIVALGLYCWLVTRLWPDESSGSNWFALLILLSEGLVVLLLLIRKPTMRISTDFRDWAAAAAGTFLALLVTKGGEPLAAAPGAALMLIGLVTHVGAKLSLWRSFGLVAAHRGLKVNGMYAFVRHPMYAGYVISHVGFLLVAPSWWNLSIYLAVWALLVARIFAEERVLSLDPDYRAFQARVPYRLVPGVY